MRERVDKKETVPRSPEWLVDWQKELLETGAIYIPVVLETGLEDILDPDSCIICESPTVKVFTHHSVVSSNKKLVIGTENMPAYRCEKCSSEPAPKGEPELTEPIEYFSVEGLIDFFTKARTVLLQHGDTETANAFTALIEHDQRDLDQLRNQA